MIEISFMIALLVAFLYTWNIEKLFDRESGPTFRRLSRIWIKMVLTAGIPMGFLYLCSYI